MPVRSALLPLAAALALAAAVTAAFASPRPDPLDPQAPVPQASHRSSLGAYRGALDVTPLGWKEANERVGRIGGWRSYAREVEQADEAPPQREAPAGQHRH